MTKKARRCRAFLILSDWTLIEISLIVLTWTPNQFNISHWCLVATAITALHDTQVTARAFDITWTQLFKQLAYRFLPLRDAVPWPWVQLS